MKGLFQCPPWEWVKDPPAGEGQVGQIQHCRAVTFSLFGQERGLVRDMELSLQERRRGRKSIFFNGKEGGMISNNIVIIYKEK